MTEINILKLREECETAIEQHILKAVTQFRESTGVEIRDFRLHVEKIDVRNINRPDEAEFLYNVIVCIDI